MVRCQFRLSSWDGSSDTKERHARLSLRANVPAGHRRDRVSPTRRLRVGRQVGSCFTATASKREFGGSHRRTVSRQRPRRLCSRPAVAETRWRGHIRRVGRAEAEWGDARLVIPRQWGGSSNGLSPKSLTTATRMLRTDLRGLNSSARLCRVATTFSLFPVFAYAGQTVRVR
jgi:hypothetical protein